MPNYTENKNYKLESSILRRDICFSFGDFKYKVVEITTKEKKEGKESKYNIDVFVMYFDIYSNKYVMINCVGGLIEELVNQVLAKE